MKMWKSVWHPEATGEGRHEERQRQEEVRIIFGRMLALVYYRTVCNNDYVVTISLRFSYAFIIIVCMHVRIAVDLH